MERWRSGARNAVFRIVGLCLVAEAIVLGDAAIESRPDARSHEAGFTSLFVHQQGYGRQSEFARGYEFADGEAMNVIAIAGWRAPGCIS